MIIFYLNDIFTYLFIFEFIWYLCDNYLVWLVVIMFGVMIIRIFSYRDLVKCRNVDDLNLDRFKIRNVYLFGLKY